LIRISSSREDDAPSSPIQFEASIRVANQSPSVLTASDLLVDTKG
jgi:hypothetical protein